MLKLLLKNNATELNKGTSSPCYQILIPRRTGFSPFNYNLNLFKVSSFLTGLLPLVSDSCKIVQTGCHTTIKAFGEWTLMLEHLTYNNSKHGRRERESKREGGEREIAREREKGGPSQCAQSIFTLSTLLQTRRSLQAQVEDANQSINFKLYLRDQPGDLRARRVSRSAIVDQITSSGLCARKERKQRFKSGLF